MNKQILTLVAVVGINTYVDFKNDNVVLVVRAAFALLSIASYLIWTQIITPKVCGRGVVALPLLAGEAVF